MNENQSESRILSFNSLKQTFPSTIPILTGFLALGTAYGILMASKGFNVFWSLAFSIFCFGGSMQFVAITLLTTAFNPLQAFLLSLMVNARHLFYGISFLQKYKGLGLIKNLLIFWLCDESFSVISSVEPPKGVDRKAFYFWVSFLDYSYWLLGTAIGGIIGGLVEFDTKGLDFVLTALFVVLLMEQWKKKENRIYCIIGVIGTIASRIIFGADNVVIPAMVIILVMILGMKFVTNKKNIDKIK